MDQISETGTERVRTMANSILERFNEEQVSPEEAGWVILALTHRLLTILEKTRQNARPSSYNLSVWSTSIWLET